MKLFKFYSIIATMLIITILLLASSVFLLASPQILKTYDRYNYNCVYYALDTANHYERFGLDTRYRRLNNHVWVEVYYFGNWHRYEGGLRWYNTGQGWEITLEQLLRHKEYWENREN